MSRFKQLACLELGGEAIMPALVKELHTLVPSLRSMFFFAHANGTLAKVYTESVEHAHITQLYLDEFHGKPGRQIPGQSFDEAMSSQVGVQDLESLRVDEHAFRRTDFYNLLFRPVGRGANYIRLVMRERERGLGMVTIFRGPGDSHFTQADKRRLASLETFFVHALNGGGNSDVPLVESSRSGMIIADRDGKPMYYSAVGRDLLFRATHPGISPGAIRVQWNVLPLPLRELCRDLARIFAGDDAQSPPSYFHRNVLGGFTFRAHWLQGDNAPANGLIGITVSHHEPLPLKLVRQAGELSLTRRQAEVCVLMASGVSHEKIAERLGISRHTANEHGRWIYNKLKVHNRTELLAKLLAN